MQIYAKRLRSTVVFIFKYTYKEINVVVENLKSSKTNHALLREINNKKKSNNIETKN